MKAILIFETNDDISKLYANVYKEDDKGNGEIVLSYLPLRPMPERVDFDNRPSGFNWDVMDGWNWCIDEILGETE